jgi:integrase
LRESITLPVVHKQLSAPMSNQQILSLQAESTERQYKQYSSDYLTFRQTEANSEAVVLAFLTKQAETKAASTLWTIFSHVKKHLLLECSFDLGPASRITHYLKTLNRFHVKKKAYSLTRDQIFDYLRRAPSEGRFLVIKLALLSGYFGALRGCELVALCWEDIALAQEGILLIIRKSKTDRAGIGSTKLLPKMEEEALCPVHYFGLYKSQVKNPTGRLFVHFQSGAFVRTPVGKNVIAGFPREIATFLCIDSPEKYTGHAFRVSSATALADSGANTLTLKRHGRWRSETIAEEYVRESKQSRIDVAGLLSGGTMELVKPEPGKVQSPQTAIVFNNCVFSSTVVFKDNDKEA